MKFSLEHYDVHPCENSIHQAYLLFCFGCPFPMSKSLYYYRQSRRVHYDTINGVATLSPVGYSMKSSEVITTYNLEAILGILKVELPSSRLHNYLFFVTQSDVAGYSNSSSDMATNAYRGNIFRIRKVSYISLTGPSKCDEADIVKNLLEERIFYYTFDEVKEYYTWNQRLKKNFQEILSSSASKRADMLAKDEALNSRSPFMRSRSKDSYGENTVEPDSPLNFNLFHDPMDSPHFGLVNMFCGYFENQHLYNVYLYNYEICSMISTNKIGPRMLSRGVNEEGDVSFFVKTIFKRTVANKGSASDIASGSFLFTIYRGSVPLFWSQPDPLKPQKIHFDRNPSENELAFLKHFNKISNGKVEINVSNNQIKGKWNECSPYSSIPGSGVTSDTGDTDSNFRNIFVIDLLSHRKYESILSKMYGRFCLKHGIEYMNFNFNSHVSDYDSLKRLFYQELEKLFKNNTDQVRCAMESNSLSLNNATLPRHKQRLESICLSDTSAEENDRWSGERLDNEPNEEEDALPDDIEYVFNSENITFRVNCLDCLDRTNLCQFLLFNYFFTRNKVIPNSSKHSIANDGLSVESNIVKLMWKNNGNALAQMYTGSAALKSEFATEKKQTLAGRVNDIVISANRMINNKFTDKEKQKAIDVLLGRQRNETN